MTSNDKPQSAGRAANDALPAGERPGLVSSEGVQRTAEKERRSAGPDGPSAAEIAARTVGPAPVRADDGDAADRERGREGRDAQGKA